MSFSSLKPGMKSAKEVRRAGAGSKGVGGTPETPGVKGLE